MPRYKVHTFIFEAGDDQGAVARIKLAAPEIPTQVIQEYLWVYDRELESWRPAYRDTHTIAGKWQRRVALYKACDRFASAQLLREVKVKVDNT